MRVLTGRIVNETNHRLVLICTFGATIWLSVVKYLSPGRPQMLMVSLKYKYFFCLSITEIMTKAIPKSPMIQGRDIFHKFLGGCLGMEIAKLLGKFWITAEINSPRSELLIS